MNNEVLEVVIIGAGHAGLSASYFLKKSGLRHIVFERGKIGESWRSQRWDSFVMNSRNGLNMLPGQDMSSWDLHAFALKKQFVYSLESYASRFRLPVLEQAEVIAVERSAGMPDFTITVLANGTTKEYRSRQVIICSGSQNLKNIPAFSSHLSPDITQLHTSEYKNPWQLPKGGVLVVGSAQSGCQVAEELALSGRKVYLSTSMVGRVPRRYRGKDIMEWLLETKFFEARKEDIPDPAMLHMKAPQLTGTGGGTETISLQSLANKGVVILGRMKNTDGNTVSFEPNAAFHVRFADDFSKGIKALIDGYILTNQLAAPAPEADSADIPDVHASCASDLTSLDLTVHNINSIVWATGFKPNFNYIKLPVLENDGSPKHESGVSAIEGLYFLGLSWLRKRKSAIIYGAGDDAAFICQKVYAHSNKRFSNMCKQNVII